MDKVPQAGYSIKGLWISGFQRGQLFKNLLLGSDASSRLILLASYEPLIHLL